MNLLPQRNPIRDQVAIAGLGRSSYSRDRGTTELSMVLEAATAAIHDAGLTGREIDGVVGGGLHTGGIDPAVVASALGLPALTYWAGARPPIGNHLTAAVNAVWSGTANAVLVYHSMYRLGRDPFRARAAFGLPDGRAMLGDGHTESEPWGMFGPTGYAAWAARYLDRFARTREDFGLVALNDRAGASDNPGAVMREPLDMAAYLSGRMIREPLCVFDMDVPVDGADAFVVTTSERARDLPARPVLVHALSMGLTAHPEEHLTAGLDHTGQTVAARALLARSELTLRDFDVLFPYDGFSFITLHCLEQYGFCEPGEGGDFLREHWNPDRGRVLIDGRVPINPHGGSLSEGGSQGAGHLREAVLQLRHDAGDRQVGNARTALLSPGGLFFNAQGIALRTN
ncbi:thiolase family protein [Nocardia sp. alder85J]|uniref:thiolase family protein n=1 Tax=Nocardia sp. alder85J TaxID=2862949 RepID=UPI0022518B34|nr:thiolase family protein [Nocardia sp. alder85J]MCX4095761.1 thiolase family protein [Nocardia sp. alder85J]